MRFKSGISKSIEGSHILNDVCINVKSRAMLAKPDLLILDERIKQLGPAGDY